GLQGKRGLFAVLAMQAELFQLFHCILIDGAGYCFRLSLFLSWHMFSLLCSVVLARCHAHWPRLARGLELLKLAEPPVAQCVDADWFWKLASTQPPLNRAVAHAVAACRGPHGQKALARVVIHARQPPAPTDTSQSARWRHALNERN